jgi:putative DNA primase/helicase
LSDDSGKPHGILDALDAAEEFAFDPIDDSTEENPAPLGDAEREEDAQEGRAPGEISDIKRWRKAERDNRNATFRYRVAARCSRFPLTDLGNAQRFVARFGKNFFFVPEWGWLAWDKRRWNTKDADSILNRAVHMTVKAIATEARALELLSAACDPPFDERLAHYKAHGEDVPGCFDPIIDYKSRSGEYITKSMKLRSWANASQSNSHITCIARLAQAYLTATPDKFDADLTAINVANGTLRIAKVENGDYVNFSRHRRTDMMTKISEVKYDREAASPVYDRFLARVQPDEGVRRHLNAWGGVSLTGLPLARMAFWYGKGRNGKSTLADCWAHVIGEYSQTIPIESFLDQGRTRRGGEASPDIAALPGVRFLRTSEPEKGAKLAESLVKLVTGGEPLRARHLNRDFFEFRPAFKMTMQGNYTPNVSGTDEGFWRRMTLVPWNVTIPEEEVDVALPEKLKAEASGILNRLLDGLCDFLDHGLWMPDQVVEATQGYRDDSDPIGRFLADCTLAVPQWQDEHGKKIDARVPGKEFFELYKAWALAEGEKVWSAKGFSRGLQDHGIRRFKSSGIFYLGISMTKEPADFAGQEMEGTDDKKRH